MPQHIVEQGEYLAKIAKKYGFSDYRTLWDHPENAALKQERKNPNVLFPGDQLFIPLRETKDEAATTTKKHRFEMLTRRQMLRLWVSDPRRQEPVANAACVLRVDGQEFNLQTDGDGVLEQVISADASSAELVVKKPDTALTDRPIKIAIGQLDPVEKASGQKARLCNLGYFPAAPDNPDEALFRSAVEEFQCDQGLTVDGICGPKTQAKLKLVHGC